MTRSKIFAHAAIAALLCAGLFASIASAQTDWRRTTTAQGNVAATAPTIRNNDVASITDTVRRPRYQVRLISIHANNETGPDWPGSDEIFAVYETAGYHAATPTYGDIDTGDTQRINLRHACVYPAVDPDRQRNGAWRCQSGGATGALDFRISLYETDGDVPWNWGACLGGGSSDLIARADALRCPTESTSRVFSYGRSITEAALATLLPEQNTHRDFEEHGEAYSITYRIIRGTDLVTEEERALQR